MARGRGFRSNVLRERRQTRSHMSAPLPGDLGRDESRSGRCSDKRDRKPSKNPPPPSWEGPKDPKAVRKKKARMFLQVPPTAPVEPRMRPAWQCSSCQATCGKASSKTTSIPKSIILPAVGRVFCTQVSAIGDRGAAEHA